MFRLQVTIIRQTFQYMDMSCPCTEMSVPVTSNHHQADISVHGYVMSMY